MLAYIDSRKMGRRQYEWLNSYFHFSFVEYRNPTNVQFGVLRVVNDDELQPGTGFDLHPHRNMEILSYVIDGEMTHVDGLGNQHVLSSGQVQYIGAGTGLWHSGRNAGDTPLRFLQIWMFPDREGYAPSYSECLFGLDDRRDKWLSIAAGAGYSDSCAPIRIRADVNVYAAIISEGKRLEFNVEKGRQAYLVLIDGQADVSDIVLSKRDALKIVEEGVTIIAEETSHVLVIEMAKG